MKDLGKLEGPIEPFDSLFRWIISKGIGIIFCPDTLGGGFKYLLFSHLLREDSQFDSYFSDGLKPPSRCKSRIPFCFWPPLLSKKIYKLNLLSTCFCDSVCILHDWFGLRCLVPLAFVSRSGSVEMGGIITAGFTVFLPP